MSSLLTNNLSQKASNPYLSELPGTFWDALEESNRQSQASNLPCALVLQAEYDDHRQSIRGASSQHLILQLAKTHLVVIKTVGKGALVGKTINKTACEMGQSIRLLCIIAHGEQDGVRFGQLEASYDTLDWTSSDLRREDFMRLHRDSRIALLACNTGLGFAQKLADCSKRIVLAPKNVMYIDLTVFSCSRNLFSYASDESLNMDVFIPYQKSRSIFALDATTSKSLFDERFGYLENRAASGDANAQLTLGLFHLKGVGGRLRSDETALHWYLLAAKQGMAQAQYKVGLFYWKGMGGLVRDDQQALKWFLLAAKQGHARSQYLVGFFAIQGRGGFAVSENEGAYWFRLSAEAGNAEAQFMLGIGYERGMGGLTQSDQDALFWYKLAADQGSEKAKECVKRLSELDQPLNQTEKSGLTSKMSIHFPTSEKTRGHEICRTPIEDSF